MILIQLSKNRDLQKFPGILGRSRKYSILIRSRLDWRRIQKSYDVTMVRGKMTNLHGKIDTLAEWNTVRRRQWDERQMVERKCRKIRNTEWYMVPVYLQCSWKVGIEETISIFVSTKKRSYIIDRRKIFLNRVINISRMTKILVLILYNFVLSHILFFIVSFI